MNYVPASNDPNAMPEGFYMSGKDAAAYIIQLEHELLLQDGNYRRYNNWLEAVAGDK